jgi:hypothetical protein
LRWLLDRSGREWRESNCVQRDVQNNLDMNKFNVIARQALTKPPPTLTMAQKVLLTEVTQMALLQNQKRMQGTQILPRGPWNLDTFKLVRKLEEQFTRGQSVAIMRSLNAMLRDAVSDFRSNSMGNVDLENTVYLHKTQVADLKSESNLSRANNLNTLRAELASLQADFDRLTSNFSEEILTLKSDITVEQATKKAEVRDETKKLDLQITGLTNKLNVELASQRTMLEQVKVNLTRALLWGAVGAFAVFMGVDVLSQNL